MRVVKDPAFQDNTSSAAGRCRAINTPEEFAKEILEDRAAARDVVKESGLEPQ